MPAGVRSWIRACIEIRKIGWEGLPSEPQEMSQQEKGGAKLVVCYGAGDETGGLDTRKYFQPCKNGVFFMYLLGTQLLLFHGHNITSTRTYWESHCIYWFLFLSNIFQCACARVYWSILLLVGTQLPSRFFLLHMVLARMGVSLWSLMSENILWVFTWE